MNMSDAMKCPSCGHDDMNGHGATLTPSFVSWKRKCPNCELVLLIVPMEKDAEYQIKKITAENREKSTNSKQEMISLLDEMREKLNHI